MKYQKVIPLFFMLAIGGACCAQTISTVAGSGNRGYADGASTVAEFSYPTGVAVDAAGNVYVADMDNNVIKKFTTGTGTVTTVAGNYKFAAMGWGEIGSGMGSYSGDGTSAVHGGGLSSPVSVAVDGAGNIYIADAMNHAIRKVDKAGIITTIAGNGTAGFAGNGAAATTALLDTPICVVVDKANNVYIADRGNNMVRKISAAGMITTIAGNGSAIASGDGGPATAAGMSVFTLALDAAGNLYIGDAGNLCIRKVNTAGIISTIVGPGGKPSAPYIVQPMGLAADGGGNLFIADAINQVIWKLSATNDSMYLFCGGNGRGAAGDGGPATAAQLLVATGLATDNNGNLYIADKGNHKIRKVHYSTAAVTDPYHESAAIRVHPNPATGVLHISSVEVVHTITILNALGQVVVSGKYNSRNIDINIADLANGIYYLNVNKNIQRFIKQSHI